MIRTAGNQRVLRTAAPSRYFAFDNNSIRAEPFFINRYVMGKTNLRGNATAQEHKFILSQSYSVPSEDTTASH